MVLLQQRPTLGGRSIEWLLAASCRRCEELLEQQLSVIVRVMTW
jgi:hypothetical protein